MYEENYTTSVKPTTRFCGSCGWGNGGWDDHHCSRCHSVPGRPHWKRRGHTQTEKHREEVGRRHLGTKRTSKYSKTGNPV